MKNSILGKWDYSGVAEAIFGSFETYQKARDFLGDTVEDWGCGTGYARNYFKNYKGVDGSPSRFVSSDEIVDLRYYTSNVDNILIRHTLEWCGDWKAVLNNAKKSFNKKLCLMLFTPFVDKTQVVEELEIVNAKGQRVKGVTTQEVHFKKEDILGFFPEDEFKIKEEQYGKEWILYVEKINSK